MTRKELFELIKKKKSFLCVGLDSDINKIPKHLLTLEDPVFEFNKQIIDATHELAIAYKPNMAFYENRGSKGWISLEKTIKYLKTKNVFTIADAKRGDIGNTSKQYAKAFLDPVEPGLNFDAITVAPYMGEDSVTPFLSYEGKWVVLLVLTSNKGSEDFQLPHSSISNTLEKLGIKTYNKKNLYEQVIYKSLDWGNEDNMMLVIGATKAEMLQKVRNIAPNHFLLIPGVGAQGGSLEEVAQNGINKQCGLIVNASRSIIFSSDGADFAEKAKAESLSLQRQMEQILINYKII